MLGGTGYAITYTGTVISIRTKVRVWWQRIDRAADRHVDWLETKADKVIGTDDRWRKSKEGDVKVALWIAVWVCVLITVLALLRGDLGGWIMGALGTGCAIASVIALGVLAATDQRTGSHSPDDEDPDSH